jgi:peptidoglycan/xylan/chitin deacetylase (PgdA/CDA1 family)
MKNNHCLILILLLIICSCKAEKERSANSAGKKTTDTVSTKPFADVATILAKKEVPVLCYHHIGDHISVYEVTPAAFAAQMKALADSGYKTILPGDLYEYLVHGAALPAKPVMITFDDNDKEQYTIGATEMNKYGFKGVYFIMTISINRGRYMNETQLKELSDSGHVIEAHTWDHHRVTEYLPTTWDTQLVKPQKRLEAITGKPVKYFAYPFGLWNKEAVPVLKDHGYNKKDARARTMVCRGDAKSDENNFSFR